MSGTLGRTILNVARCRVVTASRRIQTRPLGWQTTSFLGQRPSFFTSSARLSFPGESQDPLISEHYSIVTHATDTLDGVVDTPEDIFAVFKISGTQMKVTLDDVVTTQKIPHAPVGTTVEFDEVLLVGTRTKTIVGRPLVPRAKVVATVEEQTRDKKIIVFKKKRRKGYKRTNGHRSYITVLRVNDIVVNDL
jgi:large subunit ribosomal protein L21